MSSEKGYVPNTRDILFYPVVSAVFRLMSPTYRKFVTGSIEYGMRAAARDEQEGREAPADWRVEP